MYWINGNNREMNSGCVSFYCDIESDVAQLPTSQRLGVQQGDDITSCQKVKKGSTCLVLGASKYFILNSNDVWVEL